MNFIALTLEQAKDIAHSQNIQLDLRFAEVDLSSEKVNRWRVVKQVEDKGVTILHLMIQA